MQDKNTISLIPDSISYAAVQEFLAQRLEANRAKLGIGTMDYELIRI